MTSNAAAAEPTVTVDVDRDAAAAAGRTQAAVGRFLAGTLQPGPLGSVVLGHDQLDVVLSAGPPPAGLEELRRLHPDQRPTRRARRHRHDRGSPGPDQRDPHQRRANHQRHHHPGR